jgi:hypothetical protein
MRIRIDIAAVQHGEVSCDSHLNVSTDSQGWQYARQGRLAAFAPKLTVAIVQPS